jgi:hypothetical protein
VGAQTDAEPVVVRPACVRSVKQGKAGTDTLSPAGIEEVDVMRKLLFLVVLLVAGTIGLGFYLGWWRISNTANGEPGEKKYELNVDTNKIKTDTNTAKEKVGLAPGKNKASSQEK